MGDNLRDAQRRQEFRAEIMRGYQAALCNSGVPGWTLGDEVGKVADNLLAAMPQPVASRERVAVVLHDSQCPDRRGELVAMGAYYTQADALFAAGVFSEPPTREQIEEAVSAAWLDPQAGSGAVVDAVLALIGGDAK